jgi:hypothetical protein
MLLLLLLSPATAVADPVSHGELQVLRMCAERPALARALADHSVIRAWLVDELDGRSVGFPIAWDGAEPVTGRAAEHEFAIACEVGRLRVASGASGLDQLAGLVFELENLRGLETFEAAWQAALRGEIGRLEFTRRMAACEFGALTRTRTFLERHLGPISMLELRDHPLTAHLLDASPSLEEQARKYRRLGHEVGRHFAAAYDHEIRPRLAAGRRVDRSSSN